MKEERNHTSRIGLERQGHQIVHDLLGFDLQVRGEGVVAGKFVIRLGNRVVNGLELAPHAFLHGTEGLEIFLQFIAVTTGQGFL